MRGMGWVLAGYEKEEGQSRRGKVKRRGNKEGRGGKKRGEGKWKKEKKISLWEDVGVCQLVKRVRKKKRLAD